VLSASSSTSGCLSSCFFFFSYASLSRVQWVFTITVVTNHVILGMRGMAMASDQLCQRLEVGLLGSLTNSRARKVAHLPAQPAQLLPMDPHFLTTYSAPQQQLSVTLANPKCRPCCYFPCLPGSPFQPRPLHSISTHRLSGNDLVACSRTSR